ncbi:hypothetical protein ACFLU6_03060 [Acidobacteriota bacterium]
MKRSFKTAICTARLLETVSVLLLLGVMSLTPVQASKFGVPDGANDPSGYFILTGPDVPTGGDNNSWGDKRHTVDFYIEVTGTALQVGIYDPGLVYTAGGLDLFFSGTIGTVTYTLYDPSDTMIVTSSYQEDDDTTNLTLVPLYDGAAQPGLYRLNVTMDDDPVNDDEDINVFGVSVPGYDFYSYYFTGGQANAGGATITEPLVFYPLVQHSTPSVYNNEDITGIDVMNFDMDSADTNAPPNVWIGTPSQRGANLNPSQDNAQFTTNLRGIDVDLFDGTDYGIYTLEFTDLSLVMEGTNDLNIFSAQIVDFESNIDTADFPVLPGDPTNPRRFYYIPDDGTAPEKESMTHVAVITSGPDPALVGFSSVIEVTLHIANPTSYDLMGIDVTTRMSPDLHFTDPQVVGSASGLTGTESGRDILVAGDVLAGETGTVTYQATFSPTAEGLFYVTGDGTDLQGGSLPTEGTYHTPFAQSPLEERFGPIHMLRAEAREPNCQIMAIINGDLSLCDGDSTTLDAGSSAVVDCFGVPEYRWVKDAIEIVPYPGTPTITETPAATATYGVEIRCSTIPDCLDYAEVVVVVNPAVVADAGPDQQTCQNAGILLGGALTGSGGTGALSYSWAPPTDLDDPISPNPVFTPNTQTTPVTFTVTVTDEAGCVATDDISVDVHPEVLADAGPDQVTCENLGIPIGGAPTASGGTGVLTCLWNPPNDLDDPTSCNPTCTPTSPTTPLTYAVTVTDELLCEATSPVQIAVIPDLPPQSVGNTLRCVMEGNDIRLVWTTNNSYSYNVRRHSDKAFDKATSLLMSNEITGEFVAVDEMLDPMQKVFYRIFSVSCSGAEE